MTSPLLTELGPFVRRYQRALIAKALVLGGLGLCILLVAGWRLHSADLGPAWLDAALMTVAVGGAAGLGWWVRRRWMSRTAAVRALDDAMGLEQRLLTASEFEGAATPPALYPLLLQDTRERFSAFAKHMPSLFDRPALAASIVLLLLLLWPMGGGGLMQLARDTDSTQTPQPSPEEYQTPPESRQQDEQQSSQQAGQSEQDRGQRPQRGDRQEPFPSPSDQPRESQGSPAASASRQGESEGRGEGPQGESSEGSSGEREMARGAGGQPESSSSPKDAQREGELAQGQQDWEAQQREASQQEGTSSGADKRTTAEHGQSQQAQEGEGRQQASGAGERDARQQAQGQEGSGQGQQQQAMASGQSGAKGGESGQSAGGSQALRGDIQELLKELQGELQQIQQQLAAKTSDEAIPHAGTGTDPNLYGDDAQIERGTGSELPIQLETDTAPTSSQRQGSGTGEPSGKIAKAGPQMPLESAVLSDQPLEELASQRRVVPPEYQPVFENLYQRTSEPTEDASP